MDVAKYRALFIEDAREHLGELSRLLVQAEKAGEPGGIIQEVFRHVHSIKGMAATMGYDPIAVLAHRLEDVVSERRHATARLETSTVDLVLRAVDALAAQVECIADGRSLEEPFGLLRELTELQETHAQENTGSPVTAPKTETAIADEKKEAEGDFLDVYVRLSDICSSPSVRAFLLHRKLGTVGGLLAATPTMDAIRGNPNSGRELHFRFADSRRRVQIERILAQSPDIERISLTTHVDPPSPAEQKKKAPLAPSASAERGVDGVQMSVTVRVRTDVLDDLIDTLGALFIDRERLHMSLGESASHDVRAALDDIGGRIRQVHEKIMAVRMTPMRTVIDRYPRLVRDLSQSLGKIVELQIEGDDIELDRAILEVLDTPLIHIIRNAVDHGIEHPAERVERGKAPGGRLRIAARRDRGTIFLEVEDDGRGIDTAFVRQEAMRRGVVDDATLASMHDEEVLLLLCTPGFSTKGEVSDISGRGVGMDIVRDQVESLGGGLSILSRVGEGTRIILRVPLTLAIIPVLVLESSGMNLAVPVAKVLGVRDFDPLARAAVMYQDAAVELVLLSDVLGLPRSSKQSQVLLIDQGVRVVGMLVDRIVEHLDVVVKPLGAPLERLEYFSGATILGDGRPVLILDPPKILRLRRAA